MSRTSFRKFQLVLNLIFLLPGFIIVDMITSEAIETRDYCLHESFNATCRPGSVIFMTSAIYGRMRLGRCINGDFNIGCSMDVIAYMDSQCTAKESCDVSVRNLVDIHPCQRDFMSYMEASYRCIEVSATSAYVCPREGQVRLIASTPRHLVHGSMHQSRPGSSLISSVGSDLCPWTIAAKQGQRIQMKIIVLGSENSLPSSYDDIILCSSLFVISDVTSGITDVAVCAGRMRERHLYTSTGSQITMYISSEKDHDSTIPDHGHPRFLLSYEAVGCPDLKVPVGAWMRRMMDNVMVKCNETLETWYLTCQGNKWVGDVSNCSHKGSLVEENKVQGSSTFPTYGIILAVLLGVALGIFIGILLLLAVHCVRRRTPVANKKTSQTLMVTRKDSDNDPETIRLPGNIRPLDSNSCPAFPPALILNMEKIYDFDSHICPFETRPPTGTLRSKQIQDGDGGGSPFPGSTDCSCGFAQRCATISKHYHCTAGKSRLDDGYVSSFLENVDLVTTNGTTSTSSDVRPEVIGSKLYDVAFYPPGLRTPDAVAHPLQNTCGHQRTVGLPSRTISENSPQASVGLSSRTVPGQGNSPQAGVGISSRTVSGQGNSPQAGHACFVGFNDNNLS